jgi:UDP-N-acetylglucosamine 2-epimerase (non-hydrolysing)
LAGTEKQRVRSVLKEALHDNHFLNQVQKSNPYGDGQASGRVAQAVAWKLGIAERPEDWRFDHTIQEMS